MTQYHHFNPYWVRFVVDRNADAEVTNLKLQIQHYTLQIGSFLSSDDKESFGSALDAALQKIR